MHYSYPCSHCSKIFYTYNGNKERAAEILYAGIKQHLIDDGEDEKETKFDEAPQVVTNELFSEISGSKEPPAGGYEL